MGVWYAIRYREPRTGAAIAVAAGSVALARDTRRRPSLRPRRRLGVREPLRRAVARRPRPLVPRRAVPSPRPAPARGAARAPARPARARAEPALEHDHPDIREDALRSDGDPRPAGGDGLRRRPDRRPSRRTSRARGARRRDRARPGSAASTSTPGRTTRRHAGLSPSSPTARRSARRTRSARTSPTGGGSSASPCFREARLGRRRLDPAHLPRQPPARARPSGARGAEARPGLAARLRRGRHPRLPEALDGDRLRQQVRAEAERDQLRAAVVLGGGERHRPDRVPRRQPGRRREQQAARRARAGPGRVPLRGRATGDPLRAPRP